MPSGNQWWRHKNIYRRDADCKQKLYFLIVSGSYKYCLTSYRALLKLMELAFDEAEDQTGLAHGGLSEQHEFELTDFVAGCIWPIGSRSAASSCHDLNPSHPFRTRDGIQRIILKRDRKKIVTQ